MFLFRAFQGLTLRFVSLAPASPFDFEADGGRWSPIGLEGQVFQSFTILKFGFPVEFPAHYTVVRLLPSPGSQFNSSAGEVPVDEGRSMWQCAVQNVELSCWDGLHGESGTICSSEATQPDFASQEPDERPLDLLRCGCQFNIRCDNCSSVRSLQQWGRNVS